MRMLTPFAALLAIVSASPVAEDDCKTRTVCVDSVNECGQKYGGCFPDCKPWPTLSKPPCGTKPPVVTTTKVTTKTISTPSGDNCSTRTVCVDYINECGQMYGSCFADCKPWPTPTPPPCTKTTTTTKKPPVTTTKPKTTSKPTTKDNCSSRTICVDYVNECGKKYGGCWADCKPWPKPTPPPCP